MGFKEPELDTDWAWKSMNKLKMLDKWGTDTESGVEFEQRDQWKNNTVHSHRKSHTSP